MSLNHLVSRGWLADAGALEQAGMMISSKMSTTDEHRATIEDSSNKKGTLTSSNSSTSGTHLSNLEPGIGSRAEAPVGVELARRDSAKKRLGTALSLEGETSSRLTRATSVQQRKLMAGSDVGDRGKRPLGSHVSINPPGICNTSPHSGAHQNLNDCVGELGKLSTFHDASNRDSQGVPQDDKDDLLKNAPNQAAEREVEDDDSVEDDDEDVGEDFEEDEELEKARLSRSGERSCFCEPFTSRILSDGVSVTDVDLVSYKELCQLTHQQNPSKTMDNQGLSSHYNLPAVAIRRSSLQEESGAYYELCTSPEEQTIRQRYAWYPPALRTLCDVDRFFEGLPSERVPFAKAENSPSSQTTCPSYREQQIAFQLPCQDMSLDYCSYPMNEATRAAFTQFIERRNNHAMDIANVQEVNPTSTIEGSPDSLVGAQRCRRCLVRFEDGHLAVVAPNFVIGSTLYKSATIPSGAGGHTSNVALFHAGCFNCSTCKEFLVDLVYCLRDNKLYCVRHYGESLRPRCYWCKELIFSDEYLKAMNESFHVDHFLCRHCDSNLAGQRYVLKNEKPFCIQCYESNFANSCEDCGQPIGVDSRDLSYKDRHWHDTCFLCDKCHQSLLDKPFGSKLDKVYCAECYDSTFAARCDGCKNPFRAGSKKMEYRGKQWHDSCFCCCVCQNTIGSSSFIPKNDQVYCVKCYEDKYATRCTKCKQVIVSGGVAFRNEPWHRDCFNCCNCNKSLAGQRFTTREVAQETVKNINRTRQPHNAYCIDCYGDLFAKKCHACSQAITGLGGTRFVSFEDRSWHNDCFICNECQMSLVGKGFITDGPDTILCGDCARAKIR